MKRETISTPAPKRSSSEALPWILFILLLVGGLGYYVWHEVARARAQSAAIEARQKRNEQLGLPRDYPLDMVPLYDGVTVTKAERKDSKSTDNRPMDQWHIHAETDTSKDQIFPYYNKLMLDKGFQQTMLAQVPSGYGVTFADETTEVQFTIEKKSNDKRTQLDIILSKIQPGAPPAKPGPPAEQPPIPIKIPPGTGSAGVKPGAASGAPASGGKPAAPPAATPPAAPAPAPKPGSGK